MTRFAARKLCLACALACCFSHVVASGNPEADERDVSNKKPLLCYQRTRNERQSKAVNDGDFTHEMEEEALGRHLDVLKNQDFIPPPPATPTENSRARASGIYPRTDPPNMLKRPLPTPPQGTPSASQPTFPGAAPSQHVLEEVFGGCCLNEAAVYS